MKAYKWFWLSLALSTITSVWVQQHYMAPKVPIIIQLPVPPDAPGGGGGSKPEPCHSMSKCN